MRLTKHAINFEWHTTPHKNQNLKIQNPQKTAGSNNAKSTNFTKTTSPTTRF
ncbi:hypothetical protein [Helicobacter sp. T3_23-1056]